MAQEGFLDEVAWNRGGAGGLPGGGGLAQRWCRRASWRRWLGAEVAQEADPGAMRAPHRGVGWGPPGIVIPGRALISAPHRPPPCRKRPGRTVYAQMHNEKEQEMTSPVSHSQGVQSAIQGEEFMEDELHPQTLGNVCPQHPPGEPLLPHQAWGPAGPTLGPLLLTGDDRSPPGLPVDRDPRRPSPQSSEGWGRQLASTAKLLCSGGFWGPLDSHPLRAPGIPPVTGRTRPWAVRTWT